ncbi:MAG: PD-(D/E)XK nuclease family protein [Phycisphaerales bacterium]|nr:MAG: PD-(D/E)XK nuclease family protein [Phycisphaerales bacterium]
MQRVWLDWSESCLPAAADWLIDHHREHDACDLQHTICVIPGRRAGRLLLEILLRRCEERSLRLTPPAIVTPGAMSSALLEVDEQAADECESILAWTEAAKACDRRTVAALFPVRPGDDDLPTWHELAETFASLQDELAGWQLDFTDVAAAAERREMFGEGDRWRALATVANTYRDVLKKHGLTNAHDAQAAALARFEPEPDTQVVLIGVVELNTWQRALLEKLDSRTTALVHAPEALAESFDECGCVLPEAWAAVRLTIQDEQIISSDRPEDQAQAALRAIAALNGHRGPDEITVGLGDESQADCLMRAGKWAGLHLHSAAGIKLSRTAPYRLLEAVADWLEEPRFANFAALLRHPDLESWLLARMTDARSESHAGGAADWLSLLDRYFSDHLDERFTGRWLCHPKRAGRLRAVHQAIAGDLLGPLTGPPRPLGEWSGPILDLLGKIYGAPADRGDEAARAAAIEACRVLRDLLADYVETVPELQMQVDAAAALRLLLAQAGGSFLPSAVRRDQVEMLGWLELHLDTAPVLIITGCNDGNIPRALSGDAFLPDTLRDSLGMTCNRTRYGRDAYLLEAIRHSREHLIVVAGRRSADDDPLSPSRLLLACDDETMLRRVRRLCGKATESERPLPIGAAAIGDASRFVIPSLPDHLAAPTYMRVTEFRLYLQCPYRYALSRLLELEAVSDGGRELDPMQFGIIAHEVLQAFGQNEAIRGSAEADAIEEYLLRELEAQSQRRFGGDPMPAVRLQLARLAQRLGDFAQRQARMRADGWIIEHTELDLSKGSQLEIPGQDPMPIHGKIDRVDYHPDLNRWRIIDYKTGENGDSPHQVHHGRKRVPDDDEMCWVDLQLPLYHHLAGQHGITGDIELAYIVLPKNAENAGLKPARWNSDHLGSAIETAREVVRNIRAGEFAINEEYHSPYDEFARICQTSAFAEDDGEGAGAGGEES